MGRLCQFCRAPVLVQETVYSAWAKNRRKCGRPLLQASMLDCVLAVVFLTREFCGTKEAPHPFLTACERAGERVPGCSHIGPAVHCQSGARSPRGRDTTAKEALGFFERFGDTIGQAMCWDTLARLLHSEGQLDAAEKAASHIRSTPSQGKAKNSSSVNLIEASAKSTGPSARARMRFTISRKPSELRPPSDGTMNYPAFITPPWLFSFFHCPTTLRRSASRNGQLHIFDVVFDFLFAFVVCGPSIFFRRPGCLI